MIEVKNLTKKYGDHPAVRGVSFTIEKGHVYGLLGPNGAGKSTTMNIMTGCLSATSGSVTVGGYDIYKDASKAKRMIGYLPEIPPLYPEMTPREYLAFIAGAKKIRTDVAKEISRVIAACGVGPVADRMIKHLSKGYRQRVGIAAALVGDPEIIILDEPTVGLDPAQIIEIRSLISSLRKDHAVVLSSHIMTEIAAVCDYIIIIAEGEVVAAGTPDELEGARDARTVSVEAAGDADAIKSALESIDGAKEIAVTPRGDRYKVTVESDAGCDIRPAVFSALAATGATVYELTSSGITLEELFIKLTEEAAKNRAERESENIAPATGDDTPATAEEAPSEEKAENEESEKYVELFSDEKGGDEK